MSKYIRVFTSLCFRFKQNNYSFKTSQNKVFVDFLSCFLVSLVFFAPICLEFFEHFPRHHLVLNLEQLDVPLNTFDRSKQLLTST